MLIYRSSLKIVLCLVGSESLVGVEMLVLATVTTYKKGILNLCV